MREKVEEQKDGFYSCVVEIGEDAAYSWKSYDAVFSGEKTWYAICGRGAARVPDQQILDILCSAAHNDCDDDAECMRDYIVAPIHDGTVHMCRGLINLMVTPNNWAANGYDVIYSYDGSYAYCILYCIERSIAE